MVLTQQLLIVDGVVELWWGELPRVVGDRIQLAIGICLGQDAARGVVGRVRLHSDGKVWLKILQDWSRSEGKLELPKRCICCCGPGELDLFPGEGSEGGGQGRVFRINFL